MVEKLSKSELKRLRQYCDTLPKRYYAVPIEVKGRFLIDQGKTKDGEGDKIDPKKTYQYFMRHEVNHYNRLKELFKKDDFQSLVNTYLDSIKFKNVQHGNIKKIN